MKGKPELLTRAFETRALHQQMIGTILRTQHIAKWNLYSGNSKSETTGHVNICIFLFNLIVL